MPEIHEIRFLENLGLCCCGFVAHKDKFPRYEGTGHDFIFCPVAEQESRQALQNQEV